MLLYEFKADLNAYLAALGPDAPVHSLAEVIEFNERHADRVMPYFGQEIMVMAQERGPLTDEKYLQALADCRRLARDEGIDETLAEHQAGCHHRAFRRPGLADRLHLPRRSSGGSSSPAAVAGYPEHHRARRLHLRPAGRHLVHGRGLERAAADPVRVRVRAGDEGEKTA